MTSNKKNSSHITIYDVAREAGVSDATVSRVFNNKDNVRAATRTRVLNAAEKLGYVANLQARSLAGGKLNVIGLLTPGVDNGYFVEIVRGIDQELARADYELMIYTTHRKGNNESRYLQYVANGLTEGILLLVPLLSSEFISALRELDYPYVLIDEHDQSENSSSVSSTNWQGAYDATEYLLSLGHRKIGFIRGMLGLTSANERLEGYLAALQDKGLPIHEELIVAGNFQKNAAYEVTLKLLALDEPPTAIFASNDMMALGAMDAIRHQGLSIPEDVSVLGFDNLPEAEISYPKLTTVHQALEKMGQVSVKLLLDQIENKERLPRRMTLATQLIVRDSCQPPKK